LQPGTKADVWRRFYLFLCPPFAAAPAAPLAEAGGNIKIWPLLSYWKP